MTEHDVIAATPLPRTRKTLGADLRRLGLGMGHTVLVHCSLSAIGWVSGDAITVIEALCDVLTGTGTLVMPAQSSNLTDPAGWSAPAVPAAWHDTIRATMPAYDPQVTPTRSMGTVAELFRTWPGALRSAHPIYSFAAFGPEAERIIHQQLLEDPFGNNSPLGCLYQIGAQVLLLGVGFDRCTALHLAERRAWPDRPAVEQGSPMLVNGERQWVAYTVPPLESERFPKIGQLLADKGVSRTGMVGSASCRVFLIRRAVDAAIELWRAEAEGLSAT